MSDLTELLQTMYTCKKCGNDCEVEPDPDHPGFSQSWCDECNDAPMGFYDGVPCPADEYGREFLADQIDAVMDRAKYSKLPEVRDD